jgi:threonine/homoserine/homoserine lactone efflux protein
MTRRRYSRAMPTLSALELFAVAAFALIIIPGPAVLYIVSQSVAQGRIGGLAAVGGVETGAFVHVAGAALGVSAIIASSATAFSALKLAGGAYLIVLGIRRLRERDREDAPGSVAARPLKAIYRQGVIVSALNPKTALFFLAFLPQFVDPARGHVGLQAAILGLVWVAIATVSDTVWALVSGTAMGFLRTSARARRVERAASGSILIGLGVLATLAHPAKH